jgi:putative capsular polysaccharide biosynthesis protein
LIKKDGTYIPTVNIYTMMYKMDFIKQFQIIQKNNDKSVEVIVSGTVSDDNKNIIINNIQDRLGNVDVLVTVVEQIKRNQNTGKIKIIRRVD